MTEQEQQQNQNNEKDNSQQQHFSNNDSTFSHESQNYPREANNDSGSLKWLFGIIGFFVGIPLSYYFQAPMIRKLPLSEYIKLVPKMLTEPINLRMGGGADSFSALIGSPKAVVIITCLICAAVFYYVRHRIEQSNKPR